MRNIIRLRNRLVPALKETLGPELRETGAAGCYVIYDFETDIRCDAGLGGLAARTLSVWLRSAIGDRWQGPGPACLVNTSALMGWQDLEREIVTVVSHEVGHWLDWYPAMFVADVTEKVKRENKAAAESAPENWPEYQGMPAWFGHDINFIRHAHHVAYRLHQRGFQSNPETLLSYQYYGYRHWTAYHLAIADELERLRHLPLLAIQHTKPPAELSEIWNEDIATAKVAAA